MPENPKPNVYVSGSFDDIRSEQIRFLDEASRLGELTVVLWPDEVSPVITRKTSNSPIEERIYLLNALRYVSGVIQSPAPAARDELPFALIQKPGCWVVLETEDNPVKRAFCQSNGLDYTVIRQANLKGFPAMIPVDPQNNSPRPKVLVTGCFDWFHSGHVRFFEEVSELGELYVVVGNDVNVKFLKGDGHPLFPQDERQYVVQSIRYVHQTLITSGMGWMDAEPEIDMVKPDMYAVNDDGDKPEKRQFCQEHHIQYVVLKRTPKKGLPRRQSTDLRGF